MFTGIFSAELLLKTIAYGVILHDGAFLRSAFNVLDLVVVCVSVIAITQRYITDILNKICSMRKR